MNMKLPDKLIAEINKQVDRKYPKERYGNTIRKDYRLILRKGALIAFDYYAETE